MVPTATTSQITGGAAVIKASKGAFKEHQLAPLARIVNRMVTVGDPVILLEERCTPPRMH